MFVPGNKSRFLDKAAGSDVDGVFLDLEDGVLPSEKEAARQMVADTLARAQFRPIRFVRLNAADTPWHEDDLQAVLRPGLDGVCLPKTDEPDQVLRLSDRLERHEAANGLAKGSIGIVAAIESAKSLVNVVAIASSTDRLTGLMFGAEDYALDMGLGTHRQGEAAELLYARSAIVVGAASAKILSIDGVFPDLDDEDGMRRDILQARRLGFTSKSTFNPRKVTEINAVFSPQADEVEYAQKVIRALDAAKERGAASVAVGGQLVDLPILRRAEIA
jgi:citrate lyase subunit beta/citryl-CoA lyase